MKSTKIIFILFILTTCKKKQVFFDEKQLLGDWVFSKVEGRNSIRIEPLSVFGPIRGRHKYSFSSNNNCEFNPRFFQIIESPNNLTRERRILYKGNQTKFKMEDDSLKIFNLVSNRWQSKKIICLTKDTLTLALNDSTKVFYYKKIYKLDSAETYDKIIVSTSGCMGPCPIAVVSIAKNGDVFYSGKEYNEINGNFSSHISKEIYLSIENKFKMANILSLKNVYDVGPTDGPTITVSFIKNGKIIKSISNYGFECPMEFEWAYTELSYLYLQLDLMPLKSVRRGFFNKYTKKDYQAKPDNLFVKFKK